MSFQVNSAYSRSIGFKSSTPNADDLKKMLTDAKDSVNANDGELVKVVNPDNGEITVTRKNMLGDYGTVFKPDGSVIKNAAPANGGPRQILPPGSINLTE